MISAAYFSLLSVCRETLKSTDDGWVISDGPDSLDVAIEIQKSLMDLAQWTGNGNSRSRGLASSRRRTRDVIALKPLNIAFANFRRFFPLLKPKTEP